MIPFIFKTNYKVRQNSKRKNFNLGFCTWNLLSLIMAAVFVKLLELKHFNDAYYALYHNYNYREFTTARFWKKMSCWFSLFLSLMQCVK